MATRTADPDPSKRKPPHGHIQPRDTRERLAVNLFEALWTTYRSRVEYVPAYEKVVADAGGTFANDHIAFRTLAMQQPTTGIATLSRIFEALGYFPADSYAFPDKHLTSIHYQHPHPKLPKLFISELRTWELEDKVRKALLRTATSHRKPVSDATLAKLANTSSQSGEKTILSKLLPVFTKLPWEPPDRRDVEIVNESTQFGAWVMLHGYAVNHFTALINAQATPHLADIEKTVAAMRDAGIPMKANIEGTPGSKLRQTATEAVLVPVRVSEKGKTTTIPWPYAYFELAERGEVPDPQTGQLHRFEGFLGPQATQLFEMTRTKT